MESETERREGLVVAARARLPTCHGEFDIIGFSRSNRVRLDDVAVVRPSFRAGSEPVPIRVHSECLTGEAFASLRCDCRDQLELAFARLACGELSVVLYMRQEGRGIGIANKIRAYALQDGGLDTVEANHSLGLEDDARTYDLAAAMLKTLGVRRVSLHTNNPKKIEGLVTHGIDVVERVSLACPPRPQNVAYLRTKFLKSGHLLQFEQEGGLL